MVHWSVSRSVDTWMEIPYAPQGPGLFHTGLRDRFPLSHMTLQDSTRQLGQ